MQSLNISFFVKQDGSVHVSEQMILHIETKESINSYLAASEINDLSSWTSLTGINEIRYHVSSAYSNIKNIAVMPGGLFNCNSFSNICEGKLVYEYDVFPIYDSDDQLINNTGLFSMLRYKPRTTRFSLNTQTLALSTTESGDIKIKPRTTINFILPQNAVLYLAQPAPPNYKSLFLSKNPPYKNITRLTWETGILPNFNIVFETEDSIEKEVMNYFNNLQLALINQVKALNNPKGYVLLFLISSVVLGFIYLKFFLKKGSYE